MKRGLVLDVNPVITNVTTGTPGTAGAWNYTNRPELGGNIRWAQQLPGRHEMADLADWRVGECARRGGDARLGVEATVASVLALAPDAVVVATGGRATKEGRSAYHPMPVPGSAQDWVYDHVEALKLALHDPDRLGARIVLLDAVGHVQAVGLGELLASQGREAICVCPLPMLMGADGETAAAALPRAVRAGMQWRPNTAMAVIGDHEVTVVDVLSGAFETIGDVDSVVIRTTGLPNDDLALALEGQVPELHVIGDAVAVRAVDRTIFEGHQAGRAI
jgi:hypothetical protein